MGTGTEKLMGQRPESWEKGEKSRREGLGDAKGTPEEADTEDQRKAEMKDRLLRRGETAQ